MTEVLVRDKSVPVLEYVPSVFLLHSRGLPSSQSRLYRWCVSSSFSSRSRRRGVVAAWSYFETSGPPWRATARTIWRNAKHPN
jgi:hypothetical protein